MHLFLAPGSSGSQGLLGEKSQMETQQETSCWELEGNEHISHEVFIHTVRTLAMVWLRVLSLKAPATHLSSIQHSAFL